MSWLEYLTYAVVALLLLGNTYWWSRYRNARGAHRLRVSDHEATREELHAARSELATYRDAAARLQKLIAEREQDLAEMNRRRLELADGISQIAAERNQVWGMYRDAQIGAGNAQELLFREISRLFQMANLYRKRLGMPPLDMKTDGRTAKELLESTRRALEALPPKNEPPTFANSGEVRRRMKETDPMRYASAMKAHQGTVPDPPID